jgi:hypothetical protein
MFLTIYELFYALVFLKCVALSMEKLGKLLVFSTLVDHFILFLN